ncbi:hypothetical protein Q3O43_28145 (plasmid) [Rhodococcus aetherivorans]|uniref:hypothetical protein n=1 Tax=Rhodococcus aetherivorans TaxID=191292 RepID=UPI0026E922B6|nr:hypothetical protein [Rhodococcus aetherivorans]WKX01843.1 hypothetical protein Q3O43_28145 [Rhodococcus aetherivorans]
MLDAVGAVVDVVLVLHAVSARPPNPTAVAVRKVRRLTREPMLPEGVTMLS